LFILNGFITEAEVTLLQLMILLLQQERDVKKSFMSHFLPLAFIAWIQLFPTYQTFRSTSRYFGRSGWWKFVGFYVVDRLEFIRLSKEIADIVHVNEATWILWRKYNS